MYQWAEKELESLNLGDRRREKRLIKIVEDLAGQPGESVPQACGDVAATTAAYDFWKSPYFQPEEIRQAHQTSTIKRIESHQIILGIQDTTNIDLTHHPKTRDIGYLDRAKSLGLKVHSTLAASIDGVPLGIIDQLVWKRDLENLGIAKNRRQRVTEEKESQRWLDAEQATHKLISGMEKLQLETGRRIHMALATYSIVAWRLLWLTYETRIHPNTPCDLVLETHEWQALCMTFSQNPHPPKIPPSLREAVRMIAKLGGFLGRTRDGEPGVKTIWRGLKRLHDIAATWKLLKNHSGT